MHTVIDGNTFAIPYYVERGDLTLSKKVIHAEKGAAVTYDDSWLSRTSQVFLGSNKTRQLPPVETSPEVQAPH